MKVMQSGRQTYVRQLIIFRRMCSVYASHFILGVLTRRAI